MPVTNQPTDQPYGQLITDQQALERLFRANYLKWVADAKRRLGDSSANAPRVVSKAFHLAWQDRKRFHTPLHIYLRTTRYGMPTILRRLHLTFRC